LFTPYQYQKDSDYTAEQVHHHYQPADIKKLPNNNFSNGTGTKNNAFQ
jgi:hypothetical protein